MGTVLFQREDTRRLCMNFVQRGGCCATGGKCLLGLKGRYASNSADECELHGKFDVWVTQDDDLLISDLGFPSAEPKQCLALGVNRKLAAQIAEQKSQQLGTEMITTQRTCIKCARLFWISEHSGSSGLAKIGQGYLCPVCIYGNRDDKMAKRLGPLGYWCG